MHSHVVTKQLGMHNAEELSAIRNGSSKINENYFDPAATLTVSRTLDHSPEAVNVVRCLASFLLEGHCGLVHKNIYKCFQQVLSQSFASLRYSADILIQTLVIDVIALEGML